LLHLGIGIRGMILQQVWWWYFRRNKKGLLHCIGTR